MNRLDKEWRQACAIPKTEVTAVTPEMVGAALCVLNKSGILEYETSSNYPIVEKMLTTALTLPSQEDSLGQK